MCIRDRSYTVIFQIQIKPIDISFIKAYKHLSYTWIYTILNLFVTLFLRYWTSAYYWSVSSEKFIYDLTLLSAVCWHNSIGYALQILYQSNQKWENLQNLLSCVFKKLECFNFSIYYIIINLTTLLFCLFLFSDVFFCSCLLYTSRCV